MSSAEKLQYVAVAQKRAGTGLPVVLATLKRAPQFAQEADCLVSPQLRVLVGCNLHETLLCLRTLSLALHFRLSRGHEKDLSCLVATQASHFCRPTLLRLDCRPTLLTLDCRPTLLRLDKQLGCIENDLPAQADSPGDQLYSPPKIGTKPTKPTQAVKRLVFGVPQSLTTALEP